MAMWDPPTSWTRCWSASQASEQVRSGHGAAWGLGVLGWAVFNIAEVPARPWSRSSSGMGLVGAQGLGLGRGCNIAEVPARPWSRLS